MGTMFKLGDARECPLCRKTVGIELFIFRGSAEVARYCLPCRRAAMREREPGALVLPEVCAGCGERKGAGYFLAWPAGIAEAKAAGRVWEGLPTRVPWCPPCYRKQRNPAAEEARLERRRRRDAEVRARKAEKEGRRGKPGRPEVLPLAVLARVIEKAGHGVTLPEIQAALVAEGVAAAEQTIRKKLALGAIRGVFLRETADPERGISGGYRYRRSELHPGADVRAFDVETREEVPRVVGMAGVPFRLRRVVEFLRDWEGPANVPTIKAGVSGLGTLAEVEELIRNAPPGVLEEAGRHGGETGYQVAGWGAAQGGGGKTA